MVGGAGDGDVGLAGEGVGGGGDAGADGEEFAVVEGGFVEAGELLEEGFVVEDAGAEEGEGDGHVFLHFGDVGGFHAVLVGLAEGDAFEGGAVVPGVGLGDVGGEGEEVAVVVGEPDVAGELAADLEDVGGGAAHELGGDPLAVGGFGDGVLDDFEDAAGVGGLVDFLVAGGHLVEAGADAAFELPVADADDHGPLGRLLRPEHQDFPRRPQENGQHHQQGERRTHEPEDFRKDFHVTLRWLGIAVARPRFSSSWTAPVSAGPSLRRFPPGGAPPGRPCA